MSQTERRFRGAAEWDEALITGRILSEAGHPRVENLACMVATVSPPEHNDDGKWWLKVWPMNEQDPQLPPTHNCKLWFSEDSVEALTVTRLETWE